MAGHKNTIADFWDRIDRDGPTPRPDLGQCWAWTGSKNAGGYGKFALGREQLAHRILWILTRGAIPADLPCVLHDCDNPSCVNPAHLHLGTVKINNEEKIARGRANPATGDRHSSRTRPECRPRGDAHYARKHPELRPRGEAHGRAKVTEDDVRDIRRRRAEGETLWSIGRRYGLRDTNVARIALHQTWKHVE